MENVLKSILSLRWNVGYLSEKSESPWWNSDIFGSSSIKIFEAIYPRTPLLAQYHALRKSASEFHDDMLSEGTFHLFRLHEEVEQDLHKFVLENLKTIQNEVPKEKTEAISGIKLFSKNQVPVKDGPYYIDLNTNLIDNNSIAQMADVYLMAFTENKKSFPYFKEKNNEI